MDQQRLNNLQNSYTHLAQEYVARIFNELEHKPLDCQLLDHFADQVRPLGLAYDLGCGPGHVARYLHSRGLPVCGVDLSPGMIEQARQLNPEIQFNTGNMMDLEEVIERDPYPEVEYQSRRAYIFARKPQNL